MTNKILLNEIITVGSLVFGDLLFVFEGPSSALLRTICNGHCQKTVKFCSHCSPDLDDFQAPMGVRSTAES